MKIAMYTLLLINLNGGIEPVQTGMNKSQCEIAIENVIERKSKFKTAQFRLICVATFFKK